MARTIATLNKTQTIMNENVSYFMNDTCEIDVIGLAEFGLDNGDLKEVSDVSQLQEWAREIRDRWNGLNG